jgi:membrane protein
LLLLVTILGYVLHGDPHLQQLALHSALGQFPIIGDQIGRSLHERRGSVLAVVVGALGSIYGGLGAAQAIQNALNTVWAIPKNNRPNPIKSRLRSLLFLVVLGAGLALTTGLSGFSTGARQYVAGPVGGPVLRIVAVVVSIAVNIGLFLIAFRVLTAKAVTVGQIWVGAVSAAFGWQALQAAGTYLVSHQLKGASASYGVFGLVLGLLAFIYLAANLVVLCAELNVMRSEHLWPRSLLTPFTDNVSLTRADERAYTSYAEAQRSKGFEEIDATFHDHDTS